MDGSVGKPNSDTFIDGCVYNAAICPQQKVDSSTLHQNLSRWTVGGKNTVLHLASAAGNLPFIQQLLCLDLQDGFIEARNVKGNTALHEAAQNGHYEVVSELLLHRESLVSMHNNLNQTPLFKACEGGHSKIVQQLLEVEPSKLLDKSSDGRTCLHVVVNRGDADLLNYLLTHIENEKNSVLERGNLLKEMDSQGNTVLHLAARRNNPNMVKRLLQFEPNLSYSQNLDKETAICVAVKLGFLSVVKALVNCSPQSIEIASKNGKTILHLAVELSQLKILKFLVQEVDLSQLINQRDEAPEDNSQGQEAWNRSGSDTPLHIAARNRNVYVVELLMKVPGVNKDAVNSAGLTSLDIARENTEYHESYKIIEKLSSYPQRRRPFLYSAPTMSPQKQKRAEEIVDKIFADRRNVELVVATLLATMTFTAVFTVPGGFINDMNQGDNSSMDYMKKGNISFIDDKKKGDNSTVLGTPVLIEYTSFKLFLIFDCLAFFLSFFVVLMWEMSSPLIARDKMLFMYMTNAVVCTAFALTALGLMTAVYAVLARKAKKFALVVLGSSTFVVFCGCGTFIYMAMKFLVRRARFHNLCGVPRRLDDMVENIWLTAEKYGILDAARCCDDFCNRLLSGNIKVGREKRPRTKKGLSESRSEDKSVRV